MSDTAATIRLQIARVSSRARAMRHAGMRSTAAQLDRKVDMLIEQLYSYK